MAAVSYDRRRAAALAIMNDQEAVKMFVDANRW
jgi:hypothetical protein